MSRKHPLAVRLRAAQDAADPRPSNRKIAEAIGVSPPTVDRLMNGEVDTKLENLDAVADFLKVPRSEARELAALPPGEGDPYTGPEESRQLTRKQRAALDELIRSFVATPRIASADNPVTDIATKRGTQHRPPASKAARDTEPSEGRRRRKAQDDAAEETQD
ncbi:helix-turn-helix transcriptional regulator [Mycobacterium yunnanensis]|uniref:Helix-turn-helix transcriptional regulator n=1 Tax=Mycobacterium yunnanensis TaxID=368477 RepID=A0A9X2Z772_9MYCO|nr:helix-turn-helix transcriptional regulator [Mycobacterium yunnanensis]MCV7424390.1 helix-turn-helix transcriptional regulator [Mycobacterium yunnanensis]